ncbi:hypothetical protein D3C86_937170 [compost metagenome]
MRAALGKLALLQGLLVQEAGGKPEVPQGLLVQDPHPPGRDGSDGEFRVAWGSELARDQDVEGSAQAFGDLPGHRHPAARQAEHHRVRARVLQQALGEQLARLLAIDKPHDPHLRALRPAREHPNPDMRRCKSRLGR